jgi:hypothetical protein
MVQHVYQHPCLGLENCSSKCGPWSVAVLQAVTQERGMKCVL